MEKQYTQLGIEERERSIIMKAGGRSLRAIGRELWRSHATIVRELERNDPPVHKGYYLPHKAQERATFPPSILKLQGADYESIQAVLF